TATPSASTNATPATFSFVISIVFDTLSINAATLAETTADSAAFPVARQAAASTVEPTNPGSSAAGARQSESRTADSAAGQTTPRRLRRWPSAARASSSRRSNVLLL